MHNNIHTPDSSIQYSYGVLPFTVSNGRGDIPYVQYALLRQGANVLQPGSGGVEIPEDWSVDNTGPIFSVSFIITSNTLSDVTPTGLSELFKPTLSQLGASSGVVSSSTLTWDSLDSDFSMWATNIAEVEKKKDLVQGKQYCATTLPLIPDDFNKLKAGVVHFSLMPHTSTKYNGVEVGILAVNYKLRKSKVVT